jgi:hypothetical protein
VDKGRWVRRLAFAGAAGLAAFALVPGAGARAAAGTPPASFGATSAASGVEYSFDKRPQPTPVSDMIHGASPFATSVLAGVGSSSAEAASVYLGGIQGIPQLICTAAGGDANGAYCDQFPPPGTFPPPYPFDAYAQYPNTKTSDATLSNKQTVGVPGAPLNATVGRTHAEAQELSAAANSTVSSSTFLNGVARTGSSVSTTSQSVDSAGAIVSKADTLVKDISIANLIKIGSVHSTVTVIYDGKAKPKVTLVTTISQASANKIGITIDQTGIHVASANTKQVQDILNQQLNYLLGASGFTFQVLSATSAFADHTVNAQSGGLLVSYDNIVSGVPESPALKDIPFCTKILKAKLLKPLTDPLAQVPVNFCTPPAPPNPNGRYIGSITFGRAGTLVNASTFDLTGIGNVPLPNGGFPGTGSTTTLTPGTPGTSGTPGIPGTSGTAPQVAPTTGNPQIATGVGFVEDLGDVAKRLKYLFPALLLAVIGVLAGRLGPAPARLPGGGA